MSTTVIAFDVHETLIHWPVGRVRPVEVQRLLARYGIDISYQTYQAARQSIFSCEAAQRRIEGWMDFFALVFARMDVLVSTDLLVSIASMHEDRDDMVWYPEAPGVLQSLRSAGYVLCTFTTLPRFMLGSTASTMLPLIDLYFDCGEIGLAKGDRRFYERVTERLGVSRDEILSVGDDPVADCDLPIEFGWKAVYLDRRGRHPDVDVGQLGTIADLTGLQQYCTKRS